MQYFLQDYEPLPEEPSANEQEPRVVTADVANVLKKIVRPDDDDSGSSVSLIAERADTSTRTVYRVLSQSTQTISLDLADRLCIAADSHLAACRLMFSDGTVKQYFDGDVANIFG